MVQWHSTNLQEPDEIGENKSVYLWESLDDGHGDFGVSEVVDASLVVGKGDERLVQLPVPQLEERGRHMGVGKISWRG